MTEPEDRVAEARQRLEAHVTPKLYGRIPRPSVWAIDEFEAAIRADERERVAALCWCGHEESEHGQHFSDVGTACCYRCEDEAGAAHHAFETTASALGRLQRAVEFQRDGVSLTQKEVNRVVGERHAANERAKKTEARLQRYEEALVEALAPLEALFVAGGTGIGDEIARAVRIGRAALAEPQGEGQPDE